MGLAYRGVTHCPECGGRMKSEYLDMEIEKLVYKCKKCGKEWV